MSNGTIQGPDPILGTIQEVIILNEDDFVPWYKFTGYTATTRAELDITLTGASSGLHKVGREAHLGGDITGNTVIGLVDYGFSFDGTATGCKSFSVLGSATERCSIAIGDNSVSSGRSSIALGYNSVASCFNSLATNGGVTKDNFAIALGCGSVSEDTFALSMTCGCAKGNNSVSIGGGSVSHAYASISVAGGVACSTRSVAIGGDSISCGYNSISLMGGVASGTSAISFGSDSVARCFNTLALGGGFAFENYAIAMGSNSVSCGYASLALSSQACASGSSTTAIGGSSFSCGYNSLATNGSRVYGSLSTGVGAGTLVRGDLSTAIGAYSYSCGLYSASVNGGSALANYSFAVRGLTYGSNSAVIGNSTILASNSYILGNSHVIFSGNTGAVILGGGTPITLTGSSYIDYVITPNLSIWDTPSTGTNEDLLAWNPSTKKVLKIPQSSIVTTGGTGGVPTGGTTGQVLAKASNTDFDTDWVDQTGGGAALETIQVLTINDSNKTDGVTITGNTNILDIELTSGLTSNWIPAFMSGWTRARDYKMIITQNSNYGITASGLTGSTTVEFDDGVNTLPLVEDYFSSGDELIYQIIGLTDKGRVVGNPVLPEP